MAEAIAGYQNGKAAANGDSLRIPGGVRAGALPAGIAQTVQCSLLGTGGSGSVTFDIPDAILFSGGNFSNATLSYTFNGCTFDGVTLNGTMKISYGANWSATNFSYSATFENLTWSGLGQSGTYSGTQRCTAVNNVVNCTYSDTTGRSWTSGTQYNSSTQTLNGTYSVNYGQGVVTVKYTNFGAVSGTCEITGANGSKVVITRNSATKYTVVVTANGVTTTYVFGS